MVRPIKKRIYDKHYPWQAYNQSRQSEEAGGKGADDLHGPIEEEHYASYQEEAS
jgi:hypothetical protein